MDEQIDKDQPGSGPHAEFEALDTDNDGTLDTARGEASAARMRNKGFLNLGPIEIGGTHSLDVFYVKGQVGATTNRGIGYNESIEAGAYKQGVEGILGPADDKGRNPYMSLGLDLDKYHAEASNDVLLGDDGKRIGLGLKGGAMAEMIKGTARASQSVPIPFTDWTIQTKADIDAKAGAVGLDAGAWIYWDKKDNRLNVGLLGKAAALLGLGFNLSVSIGEKYKPESSDEQGIQGQAQGGIPNLIVAGDGTVIIG